MPNLGLHIGFALECGERLGHPLVKDYQGAYLLGCTAPDMRLYFGWERRRTHFFHLVNDSIGDGVRGMLETHPHLRQSERVSRETAAFVVGYMSHLNVDESWICRMYRPFFGRGSPLAGDPLVQVLDRAFQFEMDRRERETVHDLEGALESIKGAYEGVDVGFIDRSELQKWQGIVIDRSGRDLPWERFRGFLRRVRPEADEAEEDRILRDIPALLDKVRDHIDEDEMRTFREAAIDDFVQAATRYLDGGLYP